MDQKHMVICSDKFCWCQYTPKQMKKWEKCIYMYKDCGWCRDLLRDYPCLECYWCKKAKVELDYTNKSI